MKPVKENAELIARLWSGEIENAVVVKGESGDVFVRLDVPQKVSYQRPVGVEIEVEGGRL